MQNNHPKSEGAALKEAATHAKDRQGLQKSIEKEKKHHDGTPPAAQDVTGDKR